MTDDATFTGAERRKTPQLSDEEISLLRDVLESQKRFVWLATIIRNVASWVAIVVGGLVVFWEQIKSFLR